jgi:chorismate synthase
LAKFHRDLKITVPASGNGTAANVMAGALAKGFIASFSERPNTLLSAARETV